MRTCRLEGVLAIHDGIRCGFAIVDHLEARLPGGDDGAAVPAIVELGGDDIANKVVQDLGSACCATGAHASSVRKRCNRVQ